MTKLAALAMTRDMWAWLAENPQMKKEQWPGWQVHQKCWSDCALCEFVNPTAKGCRECPLNNTWMAELSEGTRAEVLGNIGLFPCVDVDTSPFSKWLYARRYTGDGENPNYEATRRMAALEISNAAAAELAKEVAP